MSTNGPNWSELENRSDFISRHVGPSPADAKAMLASLNLKSFDELVKSTVPAGILLEKGLDLAAAVPEMEMLSKARAYASQNRVLKSFIGTGYYGTFTPTVILRNVLENPGWYTAYTPYQAEIAQGRLEALLNFQTLVMDLTGLQVSNASLLDEGTAAAEAMHLCHSVTKMKTASRILVSDEVHPQTIEVLRRRAEPLEIEVAVEAADKFTFDDKTFACFLQYPGTSGVVVDYTAIAEKAHAAGALVVASADLLSLTILKPPGEWGADVAVGTSQRFGVPMGFGGPHAGYLSTREEFKRSIPGRLVGVSIDAENQPALRLALQTREQHIRREKATSNICTAQVLLAVMASMYAVYHGPVGLKRIAERTHRLANVFADGLKTAGLKVSAAAFFDTVSVEVGDQADAILKRALDAHMNLRQLNATTVTVSFDETSTREDVAKLLKVFAPSAQAFDVDASVAKVGSGLPAKLARTTAYLTHPTFHAYHSETEMLRYITRLQSKDMSLAHSMIPLGSCTMKLNATSEMIPVTWPEFNLLHPFVPMDQAKGSIAMIHELEGMLAEITGFAAVSVQPNSGAAGEYAGLLSIRDYHRSQGNPHRNVCLIPASAHGTNPASAVMAGMKVVVVKSDAEGNVDVADLRARALENKEALAALMITYPSTHGVFEEGISEICAIVHENGGQVYMDGANFNALVGLSRPGDFGPDVCHLNLHKTFCIPHGGGGPGVGPIGVREHLKTFLPGHSTAKGTGLRGGVSAVASAPFGSASILPISWAYIVMMGRDGLKRATETAILNANYIAKRLEGHYPVLYKGKNGRVAHECIIDLRPLKVTSGIEVEDVAKRLIDYGFHAPTMSWPVPGTLMIEPTESESKAELDRFCEAMISIRQEIREVESGQLDRENNPLKRAPHTMMVATSDTWDRPYKRERAVFPLPWVKARKFWPSIARINNPYGDKNLVCSCPPVEAYS